jgi:hypothetical protein
MSYKKRISYKYKAFISYSHDADECLAPALQSALHQFAKSSHLVERELTWWLEHRQSMDEVVILLTDGELVWDDQSIDYDWQRTTSMPPSMAGRFPAEGLYVDLRCAASGPQPLYAQDAGGGIPGTGTPGATAKPDAALRHLRAYYAWP